MEEQLGRTVLHEKAELLRALWNQAQLVGATVLPLVADSRSSYVGQMQRLEQLADKDGDTGTRTRVSPLLVSYHSLYPSQQLLFTFLVIARSYCHSSLSQVSQLRFTSPC